MTVTSDDLLTRSIRTLAWLGDAEFEREVRVRLARRGDYPTERLDAFKTKIVCAEGQAALLSEIEPALDEPELMVVRRARNAGLKPAGRSQRNTRAYRAATALEALIELWTFDADKRARFDALLGPSLERMIDATITALGTRPRRG
jgi:ribonuclease-3 family protein